MPFPNPDTQFKPGESGNPAGKPKGTKHLSTWIQDLLNDEEFEANILDSKVGVIKFKGAPIKAIVMVALRKAAAGDEKAREWLAKYGYGTKQEIDHTTQGEKIEFTPKGDLSKQFDEFLKNQDKA